LKSLVPVYEKFPDIDVLLGNIGGALVLVSMFGSACTIASDDTDARSSMEAAQSL